MKKIKMIFSIIRTLGIFMINETRRGTLKENFRGLFKMDIRHEMSWAELIEEKSRLYGEQVFLTYKDRHYSFNEMNENANRIGNFFLDIGGEKGRGIAMMMDNSPSVLDIFIGSQKIGMYTVPVNTSLRGDSLLYILNHCEAEYLVIDETYLGVLDRIKDRLENIIKIVVNKSSKSKEDGILSLENAYTYSGKKPDASYDENDICFITYTSGTTGLPKGVVYRYRNIPVKLLSVVAHLLYKKTDILYTAMKLFHGNALFVTVTCGMHVGARVVLAEKFSASGFWDEIRKYSITSFNTIGAMIPILMKQPERADDGDNSVRFILSAACPADLWEKFEQRYNLRIYEAYGAVDGGGKTILNLGTAPVGSIGKPPMKTPYRLVDEHMNDVPTGSPGELIFRSGGANSQSSVEYFKNEEASSEKSSGEWIFTGDIMKKDKKGYLYFIGRNTESMRIKGENVSAFEVEQTIQKHPHVLEAAVYAVESELAEDEIMASITLVEGKSVTEEEIIDFIKEDLPKFAVPRYIRIVEEFPKTETFRIKKNEVECLGIAEGTYDSMQSVYV